MSQVSIRSFRIHDFDTIQEMNKQEGWTQLIDNSEETLQAWINSEPALVLLMDQEIIGYLRGITDGAVTLYITELLIREDYRKQGFAQQLIEKAHSCYPSTRVEMLATNSSEGYYTSKGFRPFHGFRKAAEEFA
ncbi:GNAT family N-acetyltransferase [Halobacillus sp. A1]|uniref:GNAT family N-acetyltransferase n=1 Tax=Halobacillus sp. A1 TaxID=2880262 RepID=UPI0020A640C9|nr:GNAT family N-acetyltransferase [Halobacillus sp. A1]MCP3030226.1 GNAT family N-acetyltransferase [Halobacillus sp. A1]